VSTPGLGHIAGATPAGTLTRIRPGSLIDVPGNRTRESVTLFDHQAYAPYAQAVPPEPVVRRSRLRRVLPTVLSLLLVVVGIFAYLGFQQLVDRYTVLTFSPSASVSALIDSAHLTENGRFLFLASKPQIESNPTFASSCSSNEEGTGILGCYVPKDRRIHLFQVTDERLSGLMDVVADHEMLHAAWDRMNTAERQQLAPLLEAEAAKLSGDAGFQQRLAYYAKAEPGERDNELHSIIGTEVASISPELEKHYAEYVTDRPAIVAMQAKTDAVFSDLENRSTALSSSMKATQAAIDSEYSQYTTGYSKLRADIRVFNARTDFTTNRQIQLAESALKTRQAALDAIYTDILSKTDQYNADYAELTSLTNQTAGLNEALNHGDSGLVAPPAQTG
jgi:hypothetical protein